MSVSAACVRASAAPGIAESAYASAERYRVAAPFADPAAPAAAQFTSASSAQFVLAFTWNSQRPPPPADYYHHTCCSGVGAAEFSALLPPPCAKRSRLTMSLDQLIEIMEGSCIINGGCAEPGEDAGMPADGLPVLCNAAWKRVWILERTWSAVGLGSAPGPGIAYDVTILISLLQIVLVIVPFVNYSRIYSTSADAKRALLFGL